MTAATVNDEMRAQRKAVCAQIAKMGTDGASVLDLARVFPAMGPMSLREAVRAVWAYGLISEATGEIRQGEAVYTITKRGLVALGLDPATRWHADQGAGA